MYDSIILDAAGLNMTSSYLLNEHLIHSCLVGQWQLLAFAYEIMSFNGIVLPHYIVIMPSSL
jgi:hypothetical protein